MGINMKVTVAIGIKINRQLSEEEYKKLEESKTLEVFDDCYSGEWFIVGKKIKESQDNRYDSQDFIWGIEHDQNLIDEINKELISFGFKPESKIYCFTYYT